MSKAYPLLGSLLSLLLVSVFYAGEPTTSVVERDDFEFVESPPLEAKAEQLCDMIERALRGWDESNSMCLHDIVAHSDAWLKTGFNYVNELKKTKESTAIVLGIRLAGVLQRLEWFVNGLFYRDVRSPWDRGRKLVKRILRGTFTEPANRWDIFSVSWYLYWLAVKKDPTFLEGIIKVSDPDKLLYTFFTAYYKGWPPVISTSGIRIGENPGTPFYRFNTVKDIIVGYDEDSRMFYLNFKRPNVTTWTNYLPQKHSTAPAVKPGKVIVFRQKTLRQQEGVETKEASATALASQEGGLTDVPNTYSAQKQKEIWAKKIAQGWERIGVIESRQVNGLTEAFITILGWARPLKLAEVKRHLSQFTDNQHAIEPIIEVINKSVGRTFRPKQTRGFFTNRTSFQSVLHTAIRSFSRQA